MTSTIRALFAATATAMVLSAAAPDANAQSRLDQPTASAWPVTRSWNASAEREFGDFVHAIGSAVAARRCGTLARCLNNPAINPLFEPGARPFRMRADCADLPYMLRAYFAYRRGLPFAYTARVVGRGHDPRYMTNVRASGVRLYTDFATPREMIHAIRSDVHSGFFRADPSLGETDYYPVAIGRSAIRPGTVYYDPNGHVLVVYDVRPTGEVLLFDAHPDNSLTSKIFNDRLAVGPARMYGGFQNFRPIAIRDGAVIRTPNGLLADFDASIQHDATRYAVNGAHAGYHAWVRASLALTN
jgi:hypothetical protein